MDSNDTEGRLVGPAEAARLLGISMSTLQRMTQNGSFTIHRTPGGHRRFKEDELLSARTNPPPASTVVRSEASDSAGDATGNHGSNDSNTRPHEVPGTDTQLEGNRGTAIDPRNKLNALTGSQWMPATKSFVYQKGLGASHAHAAIERQHPAPFSYQDIQALIEFFTKPGMTVLDPFSGVGSTAKAAALCGRNSIGIELQQRWHELALERMRVEVPDALDTKHEFICADAHQTMTEMENDSIDFIVTSPPYWSILNKKADIKTTSGRVSQGLATNYSENDPRDLSNIEDYDEFNERLSHEFIAESARLLKTGKYLALIVSDFRHKSRYYSFHSDLIRLIPEAAERKNINLTLQGTRVLLQNHKKLLPYGYPFAYVENIHHQYILLFRKG